jgi:uncharacterized protein YbjT (DUF2867 family)
MDGMILVTGATGNIGGATLAALVASGAPVRALSRSERSWPEGVEGVTGDLDDADSLVRAADGVKAVFLLSGYAGTERLLAALAAGGAERAVLLSGSGAGSGDTSNAVAGYQIESERIVRASGLDWTVLQPNSFMSNALDWIPQLASGDVVRGPFGAVPIAVIDPADVGAVAALALSEPGHAGKTYRLSGPESLLREEQVAILGGVLGRELRWEGWSDAEARRELEAQMPKPYADAFFAFFVDGLVDETTVLPTAAELVGREPGTFEAWARVNAEAFTRA